MQHCVDITETPQERRGLGEGSYNIADGVVKCWRQLVERELSSTPRVCQFDLHDLSNYGKMCRGCF